MYSIQLVLRLTFKVKEAHLIDLLSIISDLALFPKHSENVFQRCL